MDKDKDKDIKIASDTLVESHKKAQNEVQKMDCDIAGATIPSLILGKYFFSVKKKLAFN